jgi:hypothetical protein
MARSLTCTQTAIRNGKAYLRFSDKSELEFDSIQQARDYVRSVLDNEDVLRAFFVLKALDIAVDGSALSQMEGKTITVNPSLAANLVRLT